MGRSLGWDVVAAKAIGTSHVLQNEECQDFFCFEVVDEARACFVVCDGAGSAKLGRQGAELAANAVLKFYKESVEPWSDGHLFELVEYAIEALNSEARKVQLPVREFACTLLAAFFDNERAYYLQVGDGGIVIKDDDSENSNYRTVFWPKNGEYANMTYFLTDDDAISNLQILTIDSIPFQLAVFTDGIQRLCLNYEMRTVHAPFFTGMFNSILRVQENSQLSQINSRLGQFLSSEAVNQRTDDDKTLILAVRRIAG